MLPRPVTSLLVSLLLGLVLGPPPWSPASRPQAVASNGPHARGHRRLSAHLVLGAWGKGHRKVGPAAGYSTCSGCLPYLHTSPSAPLSGMSRHSSLSMAHCCPAAQHVSIRSLVDTVGGNTGRVTTWRECAVSRCLGSAGLVDAAGARLDPRHWAGNSLLPMQVAASSSQVHLPCRLHGRAASTQEAGRKEYGQSLTQPHFQGDSPGGPPCHLAPSLGSSPKEPPCGQETPTQALLPRYQTSH